MEDDRLIDCGGMVVVMGGGGGGGSIKFCDIQSKETLQPLLEKLYYLNLWIYHRSLLVIIII